MQFPEPLIEARLIRRYKRFLADVILEDGTQITVSVPNTGSMLGLTAEGSRVFLSRSDDPKRKYAHRLEIVEADDTLVGINTGLPNRLAEEAIHAGLVSDLAAYPVLKREQRYGERSRIDMLLEAADRACAYVEVKNVHFMREPGLAEFPDTVTERGARHLNELIGMRAAGHRAIMIYLVQRGDCDRFRLCGDLDPAYAAAFAQASAAGVEAYAIKCQITPEAIRPDRLIDIVR
ncbi:DNA/RNA nuclease SfsA [Nitratireductor aquimarinus]|uniref:DNA/RNA nuclease SfsA n=1 Tax=Nitratireductor aquimarinus TaxID=889300 RepID=UPI001A8FE528|nr:DNA/RNA nuclease SfsA [Nitratireductor aquimarinus]MBN8244496.1 DNA/RNA nuclease SfsA [Nitratireductor aquimarinus]MBY6132884.1 DNA/RNA nuclease SfsA [Nitratireductor aquimarinus]MCA1301728.1 DNA/RNA nuclease SfsA [Nitratireductor aquimarinus]